MLIMFEISVRNTDQQDGVYAYAWANVGEFDDVYFQIRCALHKVTMQEPTVGGKRGVSYIRRFMIQDSESTRFWARPKRTTHH